MSLFAAGRGDKRAIHRAALILGKFQRAGAVQYFDSAAFHMFKMHLLQAGATTAGRHRDRTRAPNIFAFNLGDMAHVQFPVDAVFGHPGDDFLRSCHQHFRERRVGETFGDAHEIAVEHIGGIRFHVDVLEIDAGAVFDDFFDMLEILEGKPEQPAGKCRVAAAPLLGRALQHGDLESGIVSGLGRYQRRVARADH